MIDIGVNLLNKQFRNDKEQVIERAKAAGVSHIILTGTSMTNSEASLKYASKHPKFLTTTAGVHPHNAKEVTVNDVKNLEALLRQEQVVAVGECGLDYDRNFSTPEVQREVFRMHLDLARKVGKPLFLHERDAVEDFVLIMREYPDLIEKSIVHCFTGNSETMQRYLDMGFMIGITGWICDDKRVQDLQEAIRIAPLERICIETDAPFLLPKTIQPKPASRRNEPSNLSYIAEKIAVCKGVTKQEVIEQTMKNAIQFFGL